MITICLNILGQTFARVKKVADFSGLNFINQTTYYNIQRNLILPSINDHYETNIAQARIESTSENNAILGDGRFDSPGKSAKYCTYTCQSPVSKKIVVSKTLQTTQGKGSAPLELKCFKDCLEELSEVGFSVDVVATDRNMQIAKWVREEKPELTHRYDLWHFVKNILSKLRPLASQKGCKIMLDWMRPIANHLYWCSENCGGDAEKLVQMWKSVLEHITNRHTFKKEFPKYPKCAHAKFSKKVSREKKWIEKYSPAYNNIKKVVLDKKTLKDLVQLAEPYHTGSLEVFHSLLNSYAPKRQEFELNVMNARIQLAILDHNNNVNRKQSVIKYQRRGSGKVGEEKWRFVSSRLSKEWVGKPVMEKKSYGFVTELMKEVVERKMKGVKIATKSAANLHRIKAPKNIAYTPRPDTSTILERRKGFIRFKKQ